MNEHLRLDRLPGTTQAADGLPRRRWSVAEIEAMVAKGIIDEDERFELIGGEVVPMSPKGARHELVKVALNRFFQRAAPDHLEVAQETTLRLDKDTFVEPDFCGFPRGLDLKALNGGAVLLAVEVADFEPGLRYRPQEPHLCRLRRARDLGHQRQHAGDPCLPAGGSAGLQVRAEQALCSTSGAGACSRACRLAGRSGARARRPVVTRDPNTHLPLTQRV